MDTAIQLDARGLESFNLMLKIKRMLTRLYPGQTLHILATDPTSSEELTTYCERTGDHFLDSRYEGSVFLHTIKKKSQI